MGQRMVQNTVRERSWLLLLRQRCGWTQQPAKFISGFAYGLLLSTVIFGVFAEASHLLAVDLLGAELRPPLFAASCLFFAVLIGFCE